MVLSPTQWRENAASPSKETRDASMTSLEGQVQEQNSRRKNIAWEKQALLHMEPRKFQDHISIEWNGVNICMNL